jgi:hypothetical protein
MYAGKSSFACIHKNLKSLKKREHLLSTENMQKLAQHAKFSVFFGMIFRLKVLSRLQAKQFGQS